MAQTENKVNVLAGVKFTLLGTELAAGVSKDAKGTKIFISQDPTNNNGITIGEMISDVKTLMGLGKDETVAGLDQNEIEGKITSAASGTFDVNSIRIILKTVYLDIFLPAEGSTEPKKIDYAFQVVVKAEGLIPPSIKIINIDSLTLAIWNTTKPTILKQLGVGEDA